MNRSPIDIAKRNLTSKNSLRARRVVGKSLAVNAPGHALDKKATLAKTRKLYLRMRKSAVPKAAFGFSEKGAGVTSPSAGTGLTQAIREKGSKGLKSKGPVRVLVVEDDSRVRDAAVDALTRRGMVVQKTSRPDALMHTLHRFRPHVVVIDDYFRQSKVSFVDLMPILIEKFPGIRYVVALSSNSTTDAPDPFKWGASDVVRKETMFRDHELEKSVINAARL